MGKYKADLCRKCGNIFFMRWGCKVIIDGYCCVLKRFFIIPFAKYDLRYTDIFFEKKFLSRILILRNERYRYELTFTPRQWRKLNKEIQFV